MLGIEKLKKRVIIWSERRVKTDTRRKKEIKWLEKVGYLGNMTWPKFNYFHVFVFSKLIPPKCLIPKHSRRVNTWLQTLWVSLQSLSLHAIPILPDSTKRAEDKQFIWNKKKKQKNNKLTPFTRKSIYLLLSWLWS
jgi:hypothetical protein